jgi:hypothetical protein
MKKRSFCVFVLIFLSLEFVISQTTIITHHENPFLLGFIFEQSKSQEKVGGLWDKGVKPWNGINVCIATPLPPAPLTRPFLVINRCTEIACPLHNPMA